MRELAIALVMGLLATVQTAAAKPQSGKTAPQGITLIQHGAGWTLVTADGKSIYTYEKDKSQPGKSTCNGAEKPSAPQVEKEKSDPACETLWPPVVASSPAANFGNWSIVERHDGVKQWAYNGQPLYTFAQDPYAGATFGDGVQNLWYLAMRPIDTPPEILVSKTVLGYGLADARGMTLYVNEGVAADLRACDETCEETWIPVAAPWAARSSGDWSVIKRNDGTFQWAYKKLPLFRFANDLSPRDISGQDKSDMWRVEVLKPAPPKPAWVTVQQSDMGNILANERGLTAYGFFGDFDSVKKVSCNEACVKANWTPIVAPPDAHAVADFSVIVNHDGVRQWAYRGNPLYTFVFDEKPGQIRGDRFGSGNGLIPASGGWWRPILEDCMCMATPNI
jgi:predicted lipoprotein with Yx(FWY)xxD motif